MSWAARRRFIILFILGAIGAAFLATIGIATFYKAPSCSDRAQNQGEAGIDCGGPCPYLCRDQAQIPTVLFTKAIPNGTGRTDVIASVENINATAAAKHASYTVTLYGAKQVLIQQVSGTVDLPPASTVPIFIPGIISGNQEITNAFLVIDSSSLAWFTFSNDSRPKPVVSNTTLGGTDTAPRVSATLTNASLSTLSNVQAVVLVHDAKNEVIAASKTVVPTIPAQGEATATFTWNAPFTAVPTAIEVIPLTPLP